jgi:hypothetical protein
MKILCKIISKLHAKKLISQGKSPAALAVLLKCFGKSGQQEFEKICSRNTKSKAH